MPDAASCYNELKKRLYQNGFDNLNEVNVIFETATGLKKSELFDAVSLSEEQTQNVERLLALRISGEPLQYIAGKWPFLDFELQIGHGVLIPRADTELLAQKALEFLKSCIETPAAVDLCSGSGCIAIALQRAVPKAHIIAAELSDEALQYLKTNAQRLCEKLCVVKADVFEYQNSIEENSLAMITANPPYVTPSEYSDNIDELKNEPEMAFIGGQDGLDFYRHIAPAYKNKLKSDGKMFFETGFNQTEFVAAIMKECGYRDVQIHTDMFGLPRVVEGTNR